MLTRWGRDLDPENPLPEYPRPQLLRDSSTWRNLNGTWLYAFAGAERPATWDGTIVVPFSPEAPLSGVGRQLQPAEYLWYRREGLTFPAAPAGSRTLLHFGAVDQSCTVWVNGTDVGSHTGGYLPFTLDVTDALSPGSQCVEVRVRDLSETGPHARGKQRLDRGRIWYTAQSGIWQTIWVEVVPERYVAELTILPDPETGTFQVVVEEATRSDLSSRTPATVRLLDTGTLVAETTGPSGTPLQIDVPDPHLWDLDDPFLYDLEISLGDDRVTSYAALRSFGIGTDTEGRRRFLLNGRPLQHTGVLDQGYWPDGLLTPPSDAAMVHDITTMKSLGFTMLRKHVKIEPLRWYHHCDRIGMLVWQDMVNGGGRYRHLVTDLPARRPVRLSDHRYGLFFRQDEAAREEFRAEVRRTVELLRNVASIAVWVPFNEGWGQFDANEIAAEVKALDPTRSVNHVSGWIDQGGGDVKSYHSYLGRFRFRPRRRERRVQALTEYGGYSLKVDGHDWSQLEFGYRHYETSAALSEGFAALHRDQIEPAVRRGLAATVYTQLSDVEDELNGLLTWDREVLKIPPETIRDALAALAASQG